jgi:hypothetical protein
MVSCAFICRCYSEHLPALYRCSVSYYSKAIYHGHREGERCGATDALYIYICVCMLLIVSFCCSATRTMELTAFLLRQPRSYLWLGNLLRSLYRIRAPLHLLIPNDRSWSPYSTASSPTYYSSIYELVS